MQPASNGHQSRDVRMNVQPNMSDVLSYHDNYNVALSRERYMDRYTPALSSKTLIYDQARVTSPPNRYGTRLIRYVDPTVIYRPAGMDGVNSTRQSGEPMFPQPHRVFYPQNTNFILG